VAALAFPALAQQTAPLRDPDVIFVPTPPATVEAMMKLIPKFSEPGSGSGITGNI